MSMHAGSGPATIGRGERALRPAHGTARTRGAFVVVVGPDGVGKTSVARALISRYQGATAYFHFLAPIRGALSARPPDEELAPPHKGVPRGSRLLGRVRLARSILRALIAHLTVIRPALRRGSLVVADRWVYGYVVQPHALRFYGPAWLAVALIRLLPHPDLVVNLSAAPGVIRQRKQELTLEQIRDELVAWAGIPASRLKTLSAIDPPEVIACRVLRELES